MSLNKYLATLLSLTMLGVTQASYASCTRGSAKTVRLNMDIGRVVLNSDIPVGATIVSKRFTINSGSRDDYFYYCDGYNDFVGDVDARITGTDSSTHIYPTNIPGIGMRFALEAGSSAPMGPKPVRVVYYGSVNRYSGIGEYYYLQSQIFTLDLIKTAPQTGNGTLEAGRYTHYFLKMNAGDPILETFLTGSSITIVSPSCTVTSGERMNVNIGEINRSALERVGATGGGRDFDIKLRCSGGVTESGYANVNASFSGTLATNTTAQDGVLINEKTGDKMARGVGIQVLHSGTPLVFNRQYLMGVARGSELTDITFPLRAQFYRYGDTFSAGEVESHMTFNLTYD